MTVFLPPGAGWTTSLKRLGHVTLGIKSKPFIPSEIIKWLKGSTSKYNSSVSLVKGNLHARNKLMPSNNK